MNRKWGQAAFRSPDAGARAWRGLRKAACPHFLPFLLLVGCSGGMPMMDAGVDAGPMYTVVETCDVLAAAKCELNARCYAAFNRDAPSDCVSLNQARCLAEYDQLKESFE